LRKPQTKALASLRTSVKIFRSGVTALWHGRSAILDVLVKEKLTIRSPGRFEASLVMKIVIAKMVSKFEMRLADENARRMWSWESFCMPYEGTKILLKERVEN
jgi:hypothetical protein